MSTYVKFTEENDHEGETWVFWLQLDGNLEALRELELLLDHGAGEPLEVEDFRLELDVELPEHDVDVLVEHGGQGYLNNHNKVNGVFACPTYDFEQEDEYGDDFRNLFYKGHVVNYFTN